MVFKKKQTTYCLYMFNCCCNMLKLIASHSNHIWKRKITTRPHVIYDDNANSFLSVYPEVLQTIFKSQLFLNVPQYNTYFSDIIHYNVMKEKRFRAPLLYETYRILEKPKNLTNENIRLVNVLAWCLELVQAYMNVDDDTTDQSVHRCDNLCWHKKENVELNAFRDSIFMFEAAFILLKHYFQSKPMYMPVINVLQEMNQRFVIGQSLDWHWRVDKVRAFSIFNTESYLAIALNKGCFTIVEAPFLLACILTNNYEKLMKSKDLIRNIGYFFQIDNDIIDVFQNGKVKTDIGENIRQGQITWMAVQVMENGDTDLKHIFTENYGKPGNTFEKRIIDIYLKMDLFGKYLYEKNKTVKYIDDALSKMNDAILKKALLNIYNTIFK